MTLAALPAALPALGSGSDDESTCNILDACAMGGQPRRAVHVHARGGRQLQTTAAAQSEHTPSWGVWTFPKAQAFWHLAAALRLFGRCVSLALRRVVGAWPCSVCVSVV